MLGSILLLKAVKDEYSLTVAKTSFVESVNLKTLVSHDIRSNCLFVQSMAHQRTPPVFDVASCEHEPTLSPSRALVYCSTSCQGHTAATCAICVLLSRVLLQGSSLASNVSAASIGTVKLSLTPMFTFYRQMSASSNSPEICYFGSRTIM